MKEIVIAKFEQNEGLQQKLLDTGDAYLEEGNTWGDRIWGSRHPVDVCFEPTEVERRQQLMEQELIILVRF